MGFLDDTLDRPEEDLATTRRNTKVAIAVGLGAILFLGALYLTLALVGAFLWDGGGIPDLDVAMPLMLVLLAFQQVALERYRRRKLEERVRALEAAAK